MSIIEIRQEFNNTFIEMLKQISEISDEIDDIQCSTMKVIMKQYPDKVIGIFVVHVLKHKQRIENWDEDFFLTDDFNESYKDDKFSYEKIFSFKKAWARLNMDDKKKIVEFLLVLCFYAQAYFDLYDQNNK